MKLTALEWFNLAGSVASLLSLVVAGYTLYQVTSLPKKLKQHSRDRQLVELIDKIFVLPDSKRTISTSTAKDVELIIRTIRLYYVSPLPFQHRKLRHLLGTLEVELKGRKDRRMIQHQLRLVRDEVLIR